MLISSVQADDEEAKPPGLFNPISQEQLNNEDELLRVKCCRVSDGKTGFLIFYEDFVVFRSNSTLLGLFLDQTLSFKIVHEGKVLIFTNCESSQWQKLITETQDGIDECYKVLKHRCPQRDIHSKYQLCQELGSGKHSVVRMGTHKQSNKKYAIKIQTYNSRLKEEVNILSQLDHPNLVFFHEFFLEDDNIAYIVMDYEDGGDLADILTKGELNTERKKIKLVSDMLNALEYLRIKGIVHRDLKPRNILYSQTDGNFKIADFGFAKSVNSKYNKIVGTPGYMAPELLNKGEQKITDMLSDIYSMGLIFYEIFTSHRFFLGTNEQILQKNKNHCQEGWQQKMSELQRELLQKMIRKRKEKRKNSYQILKSKLFSTLTKKYNLHFMLSSSNDSTSKNENDHEYDVPLMTAVKQLLNIRSRSNR